MNCDCTQTTQSISNNCGTDLAADAGNGPFKCDGLVSSAPQVSNAPASTTTADIEASCGSDTADISSGRRRNFVHRVVQYRLPQVLLLSLTMRCCVHTILLLASVAALAHAQVWFYCIIYCSLHGMLAWQLTLSMYAICWRHGARAIFGAVLLFLLAACASAALLSYDCLRVVTNI